MSPIETLKEEIIDNASTPEQKMVTWKVLLKNPPSLTHTYILVNFHGIPPNDHIFVGLPIHTFSETSPCGMFVLVLCKPLAKYPKC